MWQNKFSKILRKRKKDSHKGDYGRVLIVAGQSGMSGAAILASRGALRAGAGLTYLAVPQELVNLVNLATPEVITLAFEKIKTIKPTAVAIGPGLGTNHKAKELVCDLLTSYPLLLTPFILDADALNIIAKNPKILKKTKAKVIITPHPGELARLTRKKIEYIQNNRPKVARDFAKEYTCIVVLKGHRTVVADPSGEIYLNPTGNPGMASAGVGDVLCGMIAALIGQGLSQFEAAALGVYLHGLAGDLAAREKGEASLIASDLVEKIPYALQKIC